MNKGIVIKQIERVLSSCKLWDDFITQLYQLFGENSETSVEEIVNLFICSIFDTIVEIRGFEEFNGEFDIFEEILYETALKTEQAEYKTAEEIYNCFTNFEQVYSLCKNLI